MKEPRLLLYRNVDDNTVFTAMLRLAYGIYEDETKRSELADICVSHILEVSERMGFKGNLWWDYLAYIIANNENAFSTSCEKKGRTEGSINRAALKDFEIFGKLFACNLSGCSLELLKDFVNNNEDDRYFNKRIRNRIIELADDLAKSHDAEEFLDIVCRFYGDVGVGKFGLFKAFRISGEQDTEVKIEPVVSVEHIYLDDLIGYELQKKKLTDNTEAFLAGKSANNVLLFGDSGTGKSSSIKAILNEYYDDGLRMIEVYKHQFKALSSIINQIKDRNYKFIIYMDDLSFEEFEIEYKFLKAIIEGGLEKRPDNVLIYATSNRRHLVREKYSDKEERDDDLHSRDTVQEKLSLSARFGVSIYYGSPDKKQFTEIVKGLALKSKLDIDESVLLAEANKWELSHGGLSGRTAKQFINYLTYSYGEKERG